LRELRELAEQKLSIYNHMTRGMAYLHSRCYWHQWSIPS
jgi:hypothetical protein